MAAQININNLEDFRTFIIRARERIGWSKKYHAQKAGLGQATVTQFDSGRRSPSLYTAIRLLDSMGLQFTITRKNYIHKYGGGNE